MPPLPHMFASYRMACSFCRSAGKATNRCFLRLHAWHSICAVKEESRARSRTTEDRRKGMAQEAKLWLRRQPQQRGVLPEYSWEEVSEAGTYVEKETGDLYRIPKEMLIQGAPPLIHKQRRRASKLVQLSRNPLMTTFVARLTCAGHKVKSNF
jgi:hypothetical protein